MLPPELIPTAQPNEALFENEAVVHGIMPCFHIDIDCDEFHCASCNKKQPCGATKVWVGAGIRIGDSEPFIRDANTIPLRVGWCLKCARRLSTAALPRGGILGWSKVLSFLPGPVIPVFCIWVLSIAMLTFVAHVGLNANDRPLWFLSAVMIALFGVYFLLELAFFVRTLMWRRRTAR